MSGAFNAAALGKGISRKGPATEMGPVNKNPANEIIRRIEEKGPITFAEFMEVALYWPDGGYYKSGRNRWGFGGDYITSIDVSPVFSRSLAREVYEMWSLLGSPG